MPLDVVNEGSTWMVTASFADEDGAAVVPSSGSYRIDVLDPDGTYTQVKDDTTLPSLATSVDIEITDEENAIAGDDYQEVRVVTITFAYGVGKQGTAEYRYLLQNLGKVG